MVRMELEPVNLTLGPSQSFSDIDAPAHVSRVNDWEPSRLHVLHETKRLYVSRIEFIRS